VASDHVERFGSARLARTLALPACGPAVCGRLSLPASRLEKSGDR